MDSKYIYTLLERYWEGSSSLEEEQQLKAYFSRQDVPDSLMPYRPLFVYLDTAANWETQQAVPKSVRPTQPLYQRPFWQRLSIAATLFCILGIGYYFHQNPTSTEPSDHLVSIHESIHGDTYDNPEEAFEAAKEALMLFSQKLNAGPSWIQQLRNEPTPNYLKEDVSYE